MSSYVPSTFTLNHVSLASDKEVRAAALDAAVRTLRDRQLKSGSPDDYVLQVAKRYAVWLRTGEAL